MSISSTDSTTGDVYVPEAAEALDKMSAMRGDSGITRRPPLLLRAIRADDAVWHGFIHMVMWFALHAAFLVTGVVLLVASSIVALGVFMIGMGVLTLLWGMLTLPGAVRRARAGRKH